MGTCWDLIEQPDNEPLKEQRELLERAKIAAQFPISDPENAAAVGVIVFKEWVKCRRSLTSRS